MTWIDKNSNHKTYKIYSETEKGLTEDLLKLFSEIKGDEFTETKQILIYIDGTNGILFISAFEEETDETFDEKGISVELDEFWEENQNGYDFDEIAISAIKKAYKRTYNINLKKRFEVFYQTETERNAKKL